MAGLYIHIPFCRSRCIYCGFYSTVGLDLRQRYVDALCREMQLRPGATPETIYLGGGTPSLLTEGQLHQLFIYINKVYGTLSKEAEVTIEVNPDDVTADYADMLGRMGINRVSMGAQTFDNRRLRFLHRRHTAVQVGEAVDLLRQAGIGNISIDLMYGFPDETLGDWQRDVDAALGLGVEHLSAYCLMIEEGTALHRMGIQPADEELERQMYYLLKDRLEASGYEHYEISNFARRTPGAAPDTASPYRSRHNQSYWRDVPYLGLGAAAHSYEIQGGGGTWVRSWNVADIHRYIDAIERDQRPSEHELLDADTHYNDRVATALRTRDGLDLQTLAPHHRRCCTKEAQRFLSDGLLTLHDDRLRLTRRGLFVSDMVMVGLMMV